MVHRQISIGSSLDFVTGLARMPLEWFDRQSHTVANELWDCVRKCLCLTRTVSITCTVINMATDSADYVCVTFAHSDKPAFAIQVAVLLVHANFIYSGS